MIRQIISCDICGKSRNNYREHDGKLICSLLCWQEYWTREWSTYETAEYQRKHQANVIRLSDGKIATIGGVSDKGKIISNSTTGKRIKEIRPAGKGGTYYEK